MNQNARLVALIRECQSLANQLAMQNEDRAAAHILNATVDLRQAFTADLRQELDKADAQRADQLRRAYAV